MNCRQVPRTRVRLWSALVLFGIAVAAQGAGECTLEYGITAAGASQAKAGTGAAQVEIVSVSTVEGVSVRPASSSSYTVEPVISESSPKAAIFDWSLY